MRLKTFFTSITARFMAAVIVAGVLTAATAIALVMQAMYASAEAELVNDSVERTDRLRDDVDSQLLVARTTLRDAAHLVHAGRAVELPNTLTSSIVAVRAKSHDESVDVARDTAGDELLRHLPDGARADSPRPVDATHAWLTVEADGVRLDAVIDLASALQVPHGAEAWLEAPSDAGRGTPRGAVLAKRLADAPDLVTATGRVDDFLAVTYRTSLSPAREAITAIARRAAAQSSMALVVLLLVAWLVARSVTKPISALAAAVRQARPGQGSFPAPASGEVRELAHAITTLHGALAEESRALESGASFARDVAALRDVSAVWAALERTLSTAHPTCAWRVTAGDALELESAQGGAESRERESFPEQAGRLQVFTRPTGEEAVVFLGTREAPIARIVGRGTLPVAARHHVEVACHTAAAAAKNLELVSASVANEKLALLGRVTASVAHEMNNPLAYMIANLALLEEELEGELQEMARDAHKGAQRLVNIVADVSSISRTTEMNKQRENLSALAREQLDVASVRHPGTALAFENAPSDVWSVCDGGRTEQAILNLIVNAIDAVRGRPSPRVSVTVSHEGGFAAVTVRDNGPGIDPAVRKKLFGAFFTTKGRNGTGLGLFLSKSFMQAQGGDLVLLDTGPAGTTFRITVPAAEGSAATPKESSPELHENAPRPRVLVIDDEPQILRALGRVFAKHADVVTTTSGLEGLREARDVEFTLVLCDVGVPDLDGLSFHAQLQQTHPSRADRIVLMTGATSPVDTSLPVVRKPLDREQLVGLLHAP